MQASVFVSHFYSDIVVVVGKDRTQPFEWSPFKDATQVGSKARLWINKMVVINNDKHSSLLPYIIHFSSEKILVLTPGPNVVKLFCPQNTDFRNKLEYLSLASF